MIPANTLPKRAPRRVIDPVERRERFSKRTPVTIQFPSEVWRWCRHRAVDLDYKSGSQFLIGFIREAMAAQAQESASQQGGAN